MLQTKALFIIVMQEDCKIGDPAILTELSRATDILEKALVASGFRAREKREDIQVYYDAYVKKGDFKSEDQIHFWVKEIATTVDLIIK